uniref:C2H2-type domain-containing protein n=1 Tax=Strongyloides venezuelensis TaxID=75913 RepID=A0A0K0FR11_STRVS
MLIYCPQCCEKNGISDNFKVPLANLEKHFNDNHTLEYYQKKRHLCLEEICRNHRGDRRSKTYNHTFEIKGYKSHIKNKHFIHSIVSNRQRIPAVFESNSYFESDNSISNIINFVDDENLVNEDNEEENVTFPEMELDEDFDWGNSDNLSENYINKINQFRDVNPKNMEEWQNYFLIVIADFFNNAPGTEKYLGQIRKLMLLTIAPLNFESSCEISSALLSLNINDLIKQAKTDVANFSINNPDEILVPSDYGSNDNEGRVDRNLFYYIHPSKTIPLLLEKISFPLNEKKIPIVIYGDDIVCGNVLSAHCQQTSFMHLAYKIILPNNNKILNLGSKLNFLQTLGVVRSDIVKTVKYDLLKKEILKMFNELIIEDFGVPKQCYVYAFVGDHVFLNTLCHVLLYFQLNGNLLLCRTCNRNGNQLVSVKSCDEANNQLFLRNNSESFFIGSDDFHDIEEGVAGYIVYAVMQKLILFNKDFVPYNVISLDLLSLEQKIREDNYTDKNTQSIKSLIKDGYFSNLSKEPHKKKQI